MMLMPNSRKIAGIFIDGTNLYFVQKQFLDFKVDILKLVKYFANYFVIYNTFFYLAYKEEEEKQNKFYRMLTFGGVTVIKKAVKQLKDGSMKGNLDVDLAMDCLLTKDNYDIAILVTGDSDFEKLINILRTFGKQIIVVSTKDSSSIELVNICDLFVELKDLAPFIKLEEHEKQNST